MALISLIGRITSTHARANRFNPATTNANSGISLTILPVSLLNKYIPFWVKPVLGFKIKHAKIDIYT
jgi:hypothetical protein